MKLIRPLIFVALLILGATALTPLQRAKAEESASTGESQRLQLEIEWSRRVREVLASLLPRGTFVSNVHVQIKKKKTTVSSRAGGRDTAPDLGGIPLAKLDLSAPVRAEAPLKETLFQETAAIRVVVFVDKSVADSQVETIQRLLNDLFETSGKGVEEIRVEHADIKSDETAVGGDFGRQLEKYQLLLGLLALGFSLLVIGFSAILVLGRRARQDGRTAGNPEPFRALGSATESAARPSSRRNGEVRSGSLATSARGIENFKELLKNHRARAGRLVRKWLYQGDVDVMSAEALRIIGASLDIKMVQDLLSLLTRDEKSRWSAVLAEASDGTAAEAADSFLACSITKDLLSESPVLEGDHQLKLFGLAPEGWVRLAKDDAMAGLLLTRILPDQEAASLLESLTPKEVARITAAGMGCTTEEIASALPGIFEAADTISALGSNDAEFVERLAQVMRFTDPELEGTVFKTASVRGQTYLSQLALCLIPTEVILSMPPRFLKNALGKLGSSSVGALIWSRQGTERSKLLELYGEAGTRPRESIELELQLIERSTPRQLRIQKDRAAMWKAFIAQARMEIETDGLGREQALELTNEWLKKQMTDSSNSGQEVNVIKAA